MTRIQTLAIIGLLSSACGEGPTVAHGELTAAWDVLPAGCETAGIETVQFQLIGPETRTQIFECGSGIATLNTVVSGTYDIQIEGLDDSGVPIYQGFEENVLVHPDLNTSIRIGLTAAPGEIDASWAFANGRLCGTNDVETVHMRVFDTYDYLVFETDAPCTDGGVILPELKAGPYLVHGQAVSARERVFEGTGKVQVSHGDRAEIDLTLSER